MQTKQEHFKQNLEVRDDLMAQGTGSLEQRLDVSYVGTTLGTSGKQCLALCVGFLWDQCLQTGDSWHAGKMFVSTTIWVSVTSVAEKICKLFDSTNL